MMGYNPQGGGAYGQMGGYPQQGYGQGYAGQAQQGWGGQPGYGGGQCGGYGAQQGYGAQYGQQQQPQQQQQQAASQQQQQKPQPTSAQQPSRSQGGGGEGEVGPNAKALTITGCGHATVGVIVRGTYTLFGENHGKPTYKKDTQVNGLDVMLYFWDTRDGVNFSGWWFGPKVGGDQVWAYHPSQTTKTPPTTGWKVPYDGPVDNTFLISTTSGGNQSQPQGQAAPQQGQAAQQQGQGAQQRSMQQQQQPNQQQWQQQGMQQQQPQQWQQQQQQWQQQQQGMQGMNQQQQQQQEMMRQQAMRRTQEEEQRKRLQQQQQQAQQQRMEEMKRQQQDDQRKRMEEQQRQIAEKQAALKKQQEDLRAKQQADMKKRQEEQRLRQQQMMQEKMEAKKKADEEAAKKREEQRATLAIRRVIQKFRAANANTLEDLKKELNELLEKEIANCGSQADKVKEEATKGVEQAEAKIEEMKQAQKKQQEAFENALARLKELNELVETAEKAGKQVAEESEPLSGERSLDLDEVTATQAAMDSAAEEAKEKMKACTEFVKEKGAELRATPPPGQAVEAQLQLPKLLQRLNECTKSVDAQVNTSKVKVAVAVKKAAAKKKYDAAQSLFGKYDKDRDGFLSRAEISKYAKGEFGFTIPAASLDMVLKVLDPDAGKGVKKADFTRLKAAVGIAREKERDVVRRKAREEHERKIAEKKAAKQKDVEACAEAVKDVEAAIVKAEGLTNPLPEKAKTAPAKDMLAAAEEAEGAIKDAKEAVAGARKKTSELGEGVEKELEIWIKSEATKIQHSMGKFDGRLSRLSNICVKFQADAKKKDTVELKALEKRATTDLKFHQNAKKMTNDQLVDAFKPKAKGQVKVSEFVALFSKLERAPKETKEGEEPKDQERLTKEDLQRLFKYLDDENEGFLSSEKLMALIRVYMKVVRDTAITEGTSIKDSKVLRRLEIAEVVEVLEGPVRDEAVDVNRVRCRVMKDGVEGWISLAGNQGTTFLEAGGNLFRVKQETIVTEAFELDGGGAKEATRKLKDTARKLKPGEIVEVCEWPRKEEKSGLTRMKCKCKSDGVVGWVTTVGNAGNVFLEVA